MKTSMISTISGVLVPATGTWGIGEIAIAIVVIAAVVALVVLALRQFGIAIPPWIQTVFWILLVAFVVILAIRLLMSM